MEQGVHKDLHFLGKFHHNPEYEEKVLAGHDDIQKKHSFGGHQRTWWCS